jgi:hypothetical protein
MAEPHLCSSPNAATQAGPEFQPMSNFYLGQMFLERGDMPLFMFGLHDSTKKRPGQRPGLMGLKMKTIEFSFGEIRFKLMNEL